MSKIRPGVAVVMSLLLAACGDATGLGGRSAVAVRFGSSAAQTGVSAALSSVQAQAADELVLRGTNGTLRITNVSFIVAELELECERTISVVTACAKFEAPPSFVKLPLGTGAVTVANTDVPAGAYTELEFEIENLEADSDDSASERAQIATLLTTIRALHPDFPAKASMVVEGSFTPTGATQATPFRTYFNAEIEVEMDLRPAFEVSSSAASRTLSVDVQPQLWFARGDGTVVDLSRLDYSRTRLLVEFEFEMDRGFRTVKFD